ncbi:MAG: substrate-binding domain-containing protein [Arcobacteraceae bacterium]|nr:substrate-binding domain-containing protein [Arcobacteraceae bacterium]MDY0328030.1 substrate-binding domain-containing protein [Arcobacteraceae bacterium]
MLNHFRVILVSLFLFSSFAYGEQKTVLIYCGITMVNPVKEMADILEKEHNIKIVMTQGGSADLFNALKTSKLGDIYIAGESRYINDYVQEGFFEDYMRYIGYNQAAIFVQKGNPNQIKSIEDFLRTDISTMLCDYNTGSIGKMTKTVLENYGGKRFFEDAYLNTIQVGTDSRNINASLIRKDIDVAINWKSTMTFGDNKNVIDVINIDEKFAPKMQIPAILLKSSQDKELAKIIIDFMVSDIGQGIMKKYGFVD